MALRDPTRRKLTYEDYLLFPEDGNRHEILDGEHFVTAAPNLWHQSIVVELTSWIAPFVRRHRLGRLYVAPADVLLGEHDVVQHELLGVQEYWMVDPARQAARVYRRVGERLQAVAELTAADSDLLSSPLFPGLEIPLAEIFLQG